MTFSDNYVDDDREDQQFKKGLVKQYEDIDVGLKMNSYTVNGLAPGVTYLFQLCLRKENYVINISSTTLTTKNSGFEIEAGIETDWITILAVALVLVGLTATCITLSILRWWRYHAYLIRARAKSQLVKGAETSSQREMITSPSDHSNFTVGGAASCLPQPPFTYTKNKGNLSNQSVTSTTKNFSNEAMQEDERTNILTEDTFLGRMIR